MVGICRDKYPLQRCLWMQLSVPVQPAAGTCDFIELGSADGSNRSINHEVIDSAVLI